jgi:subtilisin family serine protease
MKKLLPFLCFITLCQVTAQEDAWVFFKDKPNARAFLANPLTMLSQRSLNRRTKQHIALDEKDVPIDDSYYNQIKNASNIAVLAKSKWLNAIHIQGEKLAIDNLSANFTFIERIEFANRTLNRGAKEQTKKSPSNHVNKFSNLKTDFNYGTTANQVQILHADFLHKEGFTGQGIQIAIIDAGFPNVNTLPAFQRIRDNNQVLGGYDFVERSTAFYTAHNHGTNVLSDIAGYIEGQFVGTAPDASFYLFRTEDAVNEVPLEESLWVEAAERADSLGVDVINSSLGYTTFDESKYNYSYANMDGKTTFISRGAEIGTTRGMLLVVSAGNSGNDTWKYIGAPGDAKSVFTVGAVNALETIASFSSFGPTADHRIKPDVLAQGQNVYVISHRSGTPIMSNGTSFSSPIMAGAVACFWQAFPLLTNLEIMQRIRESADRYHTPNDQYGYGVPNFETSYSNTLSVNKTAFLNRIKVFPNPSNEIVTLEMGNEDLKKIEIRIYSIFGKKVFEEKKIIHKTVNIAKLKRGIYILQISNGNDKKAFKLIKE